MLKYKDCKIISRSNTTFFRSTSFCTIG